MWGFWAALGALGVTASMVHPENIAQIVGGLAAVLAVLGSVTHIGRHLSINHTKLRTCTIRILLVVPIFSLDSFASLLVEDSHFARLLSCLREVYEAIALASFMQLILTVLGGPMHLKDKLLEDGERQVYQLGFLRSLPGLREPYTAGPEFVAAMIAGILQYIFVMLVVFLLNFAILMGAGPQSHLMILPNVLKSASCGWALNCIILFSHEVYDLLPSVRLVLKFLSIKGIVFFTFWQGIAINVLQVSGVLSTMLKFLNAEAEDNNLQAMWWDQFQIKSGMNDFLLCGEMLFFCVLHWVAYPAGEFMRSEHKDLVHITGERGEWTLVSRMLATLRLNDMAELYSQVAALRSEVLQRRRLTSASWHSDASPLSPFKRGLLLET